MPVSWRRRLARRLRGWALALDPPHQPNGAFKITTGKYGPELRRVEDRAGSSP